MDEITIRTAGAEETRRVGAALGRCARPGDVLCLTGEIGAGKTTLVQGLARSLGCEGEVSSPTFTLVQCYGGKIPLVHLDAYRLSGCEEARGAGMEEFLDPAPDALTVVEWAERIRSLWPAGHVCLVIRGAGEEPRTLTLTGHGDRGRAFEERIRNALGGERETR